MDPYDVLRLRRDATVEEIHAAHRRLSAAHHPDRHPDDRASAHVRYVAVQHAYEMLSDPNRRAQHDAASDPSIMGFDGIGGIGAIPLPAEMLDGVELAVEIMNEVFVGEKPIATRAAEAGRALVERARTPEGREEIRGAARALFHVFHPITPS